MFVLLVICPIICFFQIHVAINSNVCCCHCVVMLSSCSAVMLSRQCPAKTGLHVCTVYNIKFFMSVCKGCCNWLRLCSIYPTLSDTVCGIFLCVLLYLLFVFMM